MQVRVSPEINTLLDDATTVSVRRGRYYVGVEHLFETLLDKCALLPDEIARKYLKSLQATMRAVEQDAWQGAAPSPGEVFYTPRCAAVASDAARLAERLHSQKLGAGHLLLAILIDPDSAPSRAMDSLELDRNTLIKDLRVALSKDHKPKVVPETAGEKRGTPSDQPQGRPALGTAVQEEQEGTFSLESVTSDLTQAARDGKLEPAIGRDETIFQVMEILTRKGKNNVILVGEAGVGKTKIVEGMALGIAQGTLGTLLSNCRILELNMSALMAGTKYRGALEEKLLKLMDELKQSKDIILFIDEVHLIMGAGTAEGDSVDVANMLKPALARGEFRCIGATTFQEYRKFIEKDSAIERRFQMVRVEPLSDKATLEVLRKLRPSLVRHHGVGIRSKTMLATIALTKRYIPNRHLPDKAIDVLDQACARYRLKLVAAKQGIAYSRTGLSPTDYHVVTLHEVRKVISQLMGIPLEELTAAERMRLDDLDTRLKQRIIGQDEAIAKVVSAVKKSRVGLADPNRPDAVMLFLGPSGVGKTQLAKELSDNLFGSANHLITFDMSEYIEEHSVSRLLGAPPGYVGSEEEGHLTGAVRNAPYSILLFDEIEKAHPRIFDIFLPIFEEGRLKDSRGREVSFRNCIIILTSNIATDVLLEPGAGDERRKLLDELSQHFRPEFINRIDEIVPFYPLVSEDIRAVLRLAINDLGERLKEKRIAVRMYQAAYEYLAEQGYSAEYGARELKRTLDRLVTNPISEMIIAGKFAKGDVIDVLMADGKLTLRKGAPPGDKDSASP